MVPRVLLVIPPNYSYTYDYPPLGTPMLSGYLKSKGIITAQIDLNLEYNKYILNRVNDVNNYFEKKREQNLYYSEFIPAYHHDLPYKDNTNSSFYFVEHLLSCKHLFRYIEDEKENTFLQFFRDNNIERRLADFKPTLLGISIISPAQVIGAFTLCNIFKKKFPDIPIVIGGQWPTLFREELMKRPDLGIFFDFIIIFEGETPLLELLNAIETKNELKKVPNLIFKSDSKFIVSSRHSVEDLNKLACPDFDGLYLNQYKYPATLTYQSSRECYWNKCAFCVDIPLPKQGYRVRSPELVAKDICILQKKYHPQSIMFSDPAFSPRQMKEISQELLREDIDINWWCMARLDPAFTLDILKLAFCAGCFEIDFGFESASNRLLKFLNKGTNTENALKIIADCYQAGISVSLQTVFGFPSETLDEAMDTVAFLVENRDLIRGPAFNTYYLTPGNAIYENPDFYGIKFEKEPLLPFKFFHNYTHITGEVTEDVACNLRRIYAQLIETKRDCNAEKKVFLVEDHDEAYHYWKRLKIKDKTVVHIDAHIDFRWLQDLTQVHICNYLHPAIKEGMIKELYWVVPTPILNSATDREYLTKWLSENIFLEAEIQKNNSTLSSWLLDTKVTVCHLEDLPVFDKEVMLDIDTDFFITSSMKEADSPHKHKRRKWLDIKEFYAIIKQKCPLIESVIISYSVKRGYTPFEFKCLGDELLTKLFSLVL